MTRPRGRRDRSRAAEPALDAARARVVVVGAGIGGLATAIHLASAGARVTILEQAPVVGGKMGEHRAEGFRWDTGPSVVTMRHVLADLFAAAGTRLEDRLDLVPVDPLTRYRWSDGTVLDVRADLAATLDGIRAIEPRDVEGWLAFLAHAARLHRVTGAAFIYGAPPSWRTVGRVSPRDALRLEPWRTMDAVIRRHVRSPHLRQLLGRFATYVGASPYRAPATLNVIAHVELNEGVWYPRGGVYAIAAALGAVAAELHVEVRTGTRVTRILVERGRATGVELADGTRLPADAVVTNVDVATVLRDLLPAGAVPPGRSRALERREPSLSGFALMLGVRGVEAALAHHTICFSDDYRREFDELAHGRPANEPTIYVAITARTDPDHAPAGHENWFVLVNAPPLGPGHAWTPEAVAAERDRVLARLRLFGVDVRERIVVERALTPSDLERATGAWRGALYGLSSNHPLAAFRRPPNRSPDVRGLYFTGGTTHPGGGVPMVMLSGRHTAGLVVSDLRRA